MKRNPANLIPLLHASCAQLLHAFLKDGYIVDPGLMGLKAFTTEELEKNVFEIADDASFCLYERTYTLTGGEKYVNIKHYFSDGAFISNGLDVVGARICTELTDFCKNYSAEQLVHSVELLLDDTLDTGSLIMNGFLDVRFGKASRQKNRQKFHLTGMSTDYELPRKGFGRAHNTQWARNMNTAFSVAYASGKFRHHAAIQELVACLSKHFPHAVLR